MRGPRRPLVLLLLLAAAAAAVSARATLGHGFVYDDDRFVAGNPGIDAVLSAPWRAFDPATASLDGGEPGMWRPLRTLSYAADRALLGPGPAGHHLANALLHGLAAGLVFAVGLALGIGDAGAAAGAAAFAFHPAQAEAVAWIAARGDLLCAALLLAATLVHLRRAGLPWTLALCGLAFLSKEAAVAAPLLLLAADLAAGGTARVRERWRAAAAAAALVAALAAARALAMAAAGVPAGQGGGVVSGPAGALAALPTAFAWYAGRVLVPRTGSFDLQVAPGLLPTLAFAGLAVLLVSWERIGLPARAARPVRCAAAWAAAALLPVTLLQAVFPLKILVADRFLYLALAGPALAAGALARGIGPGAARGALALSPLLLLGFLPAAERWRSGEALWRDVRERDPGNARSLHGLAFALERTSPQESLALYAAYVEAVPGDPAAWFRKGLLEERMALLAGDGPTRTGRFARSAASLGEALRAWTAGEAEGRARGMAEARLARACVLATLGEEEAAEAEAREGHRLWLGEPPARREALAPRVELLRSWAAARGREGLLEDLRRGNGGGPGGAGENGPPR